MIKSKKQLFTDVSEPSWVQEISEDEDDEEEELKVTMIDDDQLWNASKYKLKFLIRAKQVSQFLLLKSTC